MNLMKKNFQRNSQFSVILQARMSSTRLPGKVLANVTYTNNCKLKMATIRPNVFPGVLPSNNRESIRDGEKKPVVSIS